MAKPVAVLAAASAGGHWVELMLLRETLDRYDTHYVTTDAGLSRDYGIDRAEHLPDCNQHQPLRSLACAIKAFALVRRLRPQVVISTGAAPGFFCILAGRLFGARTLWIDSVANYDMLSLSGRLAKGLADECWTQWEQVARDDVPRFRGSVL